MWSQVETEAIAAGELLIAAKGIIASQPKGRQMTLYQLPLRRSTCLSHCFTLIARNRNTSRRATPLPRHVHTPAALHCQSAFQVETEAIAAEELLSAAKGIMASQPQGLLQSLLRQVQQLFDVPQLEQLPAAMNKVRPEVVQASNLLLLCDYFVINCLLLQACLCI
jgi:hypothetical protein